MKKLISTIIFFLVFTGMLSAQHLKKDGTPDRRYKENKTYTPTPTPAPTVVTPTPEPTPAPTTTPTTTTYPAGTHLKKDGTPDMRYKENKARKPK